MNILRRILRRLFPDGRNRCPAPACAFCGQLATEVPCTSDGTNLQPARGLRSFPKYFLQDTTGLWECRCGAIGSGACAWDMDDACGPLNATCLLLTVVGIELPPDEAGSGYCFWRDHYDCNHALRRILRKHNYDVRLNIQYLGTDPLKEWLWARKRDELSDPEKPPATIIAKKPYQEDSSENLTDLQHFDRRWALTVLDQAFAKLSGEALVEGKAEQFEALKPFLSVQAGEADYEKVSERLQMTPAAVQQEVHRWRRRLRELVRAEIAHTVRDPGDIDA